MKKILIILSIILGITGYAQNAAYWKNGIRLGEQTQPVNPRDGQVWFDGDNLFLWEQSVSQWINITNQIKENGIVSGLNTGLTGTVVTTGYGDGKITFTNGSNAIIAVEGLDFNLFNNHGDSPYFYGEITIVLPDGTYRYVTMDSNTDSTNGTISFIGDTYDSNGSNNLSTTWDQASGEYNWYPYPIGKVPNGSNDFATVLNSYGGFVDSPGSVLMGDGNTMDSGSRYSIVQGRGNIIEGRYSIGVGDGLFVTRDRSAEFGKFNVQDIDNNNQRLFGVGVGTSSTSRKQGLEVRENGLIYNPEGTNVTITAASGKVVPNKDWITNEIMNAGGSSTGLESIDEGNGNGWRLIGRDPANYGNIGEGATDLSFSTVSSYGAVGQYSFTQGFNVQATGARAAVIASGGGRATALASAVVGGNNNLASDQYAVAIGGNGNQATANDSGVFSGTNNTVSTDDSVNLGGFDTDVTGNNSASLASFQSTASGSFSTVIGGRNNDARAFSEVSMGYYPTLPTVNSSTEPNGNDRLVNVGNGIFNSGPIVRSDAFTIYHNGATQLHPVSKASITIPLVGMIIIDSDESNKLKFYDGTVWQEITFTAD